MSAQPELLIVDDFFGGHAELFEHLRDDVQWDRSMSARLTASFGLPYNYAQMTYPAAPMHEALVPVQRRLEDTLGIRFNNCLLNFYETGRSKMGFHSDDTTHLIEDTGVAIVSVGCTRKLTFRSRNDIEVRHVEALAPGSMLFMKAAVQHDWVHAIKRQKGAGPRISLTWRAFTA